MGEISFEQLCHQLDLTMYEVLTILKVERVGIGGTSQDTQEEIRRSKARVMKRTTK
jgi:hypothetical protein